MYPFIKTQQEDKTWNLELDGINIVVDDFVIKNDLHVIKNPKKAIAYFSIEGNLYGLANIANTQQTAEALYDVMFQQYAFFDKSPLSEQFFAEHGFVLRNNNWNLEITDNSGLNNCIRFQPGVGWFYNDMLLKRQPDSVGDLVHLYTEKTGNILKRIS